MPSNCRQLSRILCTWNSKTFILRFSSWYYSQVKIILHAKMEMEFLVDDNPKVAVSHFFLTAPPFHPPQEKKEWPQDPEAWAKRIGKFYSIMWFKKRLHEISLLAHINAKMRPHPMHGLNIVMKLGLKVVDLRYVTTATGRWTSHKGEMKKVISRILFSWKLKNLRYLA